MYHKPLKWKVQKVRLPLANPYLSLFYLLHIPTMQTKDEPVEKQKKASPNRNHTGAYREGREGT
jgi:hypothetical protein